MKYRVVGIKITHVAVDVEAETKEEGAQKGYQLFVKEDNSVEGTCEDAHYDEEVEVSPYDNEGGYNPSGFEVLSGL